MSAFGYPYLCSGCVLTPHVLSEWMVEVCRFEVCWNPVGELTWIVLILFRFSSDLSSFTILSIYLSIQSIRVGTYLCLFILQSHLQDILTPHVLSEWMVEV